MAPVMRHPLSILGLLFCITCVAHGSYVGPRGGYAVFPVERSSTIESNEPSSTTSRQLSIASSSSSNRGNNRNTAMIQNGESINDSKQQQLNEVSTRKNINRNFQSHSNQFNNRRNNQNFNNHETSFAKGSNSRLNNEREIINVDEFHYNDGSKENYPVHSPYIVRQDPSWGAVVII